MRNIKELSLQDLGLVLKEWGAPAYQAQEIFSWIYQKGARDFSVMSNIPLKLRKKLEEGFFLNSLRIIEKAVSVDKTEKFLFQAEDGNFIEGVIIPARGRVTACISTQAGCKFSCRFCASGMLGFKRDLTTAEMLDELVYLKNNSPDKKLTHIVFMGTGEPLDNYDAVMGTIKVINSPHAFVIGARKITISTCGIAPGIARLSREGLQIELSVSLHAADDRTRSVLMPVNKKYPLAQLLNACREYIAKTNRQITFEYVLIKGVNSDLQSARKLSTILKGLRLAKVNLIPSNPVKELGIIPPAKAEVISFRDFLLKQGIIVTLRAPRGQDIEAACGQLRLRHGTRPRSGLGRCSSTMKNKLFFLAVLLALLFTGCAKREVVNIDSKGKNIICFGDSLTFGYGVNPGEDYPAGLAKLLDMPVLNKGIDGDTTTEGLARLKNDVLDWDPRLVIIEFGGNDFLTKISKETTINNIAKMIDEIQAKGAMVAVVDVSTGMILRGYRASLYRLALSKKTIFVSSVFDGIITNPRLKSDFLHPNASGYKLIARRIYWAITPYLQQQ